MTFSLYVVFEGNAPAPLCRIADPTIVRSAILSALQMAERTPLPEDEMMRAALLERRAEFREILSIM